VNFEVLDVAQRSAAWTAARLGRLTGSGAANILAFSKRDGKELAERRNYRLRLILERLTGLPQESGYQSEAMRVGIEREPLAIAAYEAHTGMVFTQSGFLSHKTLMAGASLDAHAGDFELLVSIKCRQPAAHWDFLRTGTLPPDAVAQMRHEAWMVGSSFREHHYVSWNPDFPERMQLQVVVYTPQMLNISAYEANAMQFLDEVDSELRVIDVCNPATLANPKPDERERR